MTTNEIVLTVFLSLALFWIARLEFKVRRIHKATLKMAQLGIEHATRTQKLAKDTGEALQQVASNLEVLGVHTRLIPPSVGFEAEMFLFNENRRKDNGEIQPE